MFKSEFNLQPVLLNDDLVSLRPLQEDDFGTLFAAASNPLIWEQHPSPDRYKQEVFKLYFDNALASKTAMLVIDNVSGETIGSTRFYDYNSETQSVALGYTFLNNKFWGGKYNWAVKKLMLDYAFKNVKVVLFHIGETNYRSQKAVSKLGAKKREGVIMDFNGRESAHFEYELLSKDWLTKS